MSLFKRNFFIGNLKVILGLVLAVLLIPVVLIAGQKTVIFLSKASAISANIVVDVTSSQGELPRPWEGLSQGGEQEQPGTLVSLSPVSAIVKALGIKYIRVDHVLEDAFYPNLRNRIMEITSSGAIPFISLSYFPSGVADSDIGTPTNWVLWQAKVKNLVETVSGRNGMNIAGVYYEVWNEPDGPGFGNFSVGQGKDYFTLYKNTVQAVTAAQNINSFKIGGPSLADLRRCVGGGLFTCQTFWLDKFLELVSRDRLRLDFISWHRYSLRMSDYKEDVNFIMEISKKYPNLPSTQKIITEWGSDPARSPIHNTVFDAAHLVASARTFIGHVDITTKFEVRDGPDNQDKGWGILYYNGAKKPTFEAIKLLGGLRRDRLLISGEGTYVTGIGSRDNSGVTIILSNYDRSGANTESVPVKVMGLNAGKYRLTKNTINSVYPLGHEETFEIVTADGVWISNELMSTNSIVRYDFQLIGFNP